jgi:hypothetical protein
MKASETVESVQRKEAMRHQKEIRTMKEIRLLLDAKDTPETLIELVCKGYFKEEDATRLAASSKQSRKEIMKDFALFFHKFERNIYGPPQEEIAEETLMHAYETFNQEKQRSISMKTTKEANRKKAAEERRRADFLKEVAEKERLKQQQLDKKKRQHQRFHHHQKAIKEKQP